MFSYEVRWCHAENVCLIKGDGTPATSPPHLICRCSWLIISFIVDKLRICTRYTYDLNAHLCRCNSAFWRRRDATDRGQCWVDVAADRHAGWSHRSFTRTGRLLRLLVFSREYDLNVCPKSHTRNSGERNPHLQGIVNVHHAVRKTQTANYDSRHSDGRQVPADAVDSVNDKPKKSTRSLYTLGSRSRRQRGIVRLSGDFDVVTATRGRVLSTYRPARKLVLISRCSVFRMRACQDLFAPYAWRAGGRAV